MLEQLLATPLVSYLVRPETRMAVLLPGLLSALILLFYFRAGKISRRLQLIWLLALVLSFLGARWEIKPDVEELYIFSAFSVACACLLFWRIYVAPPLAYALTFASLCCVDLAQAFFRAAEHGVLHQFYFGVGGGGLNDALFWVPLLTAGAVAYAARRIKTRGEPLAEI